MSATSALVPVLNRLLSTQSPEHRRRLALAAPLPANEDVLAARMNLITANSIAASIFQAQDFAPAELIDHYKQSLIAELGKAAEALGFELTRRDGKACGRPV